MEYYFRENYKDAFLKVREVVNEIDPYTLLELCGPEEYDIEVEDMLSQLKNCNSPEDALQMTIDVFTKWFDDAGPLEVYQGVGEKLMALKKYLD